MRSLLRFIFSRSFLKNLIFSGIVFGVVVGLTFFFLKSYTGHGETVDVPELVGLPMDEALVRLDELGLRMKLEDTIYVAESPPGVVISQNPPSQFSDPHDGATKQRKVKANRQIYLTVNKQVPPLVEMPDLVEKHSQRSAMMVLDMIGLEVEEVRFEKSKFEDLVMKQLYKGKELEPGTKLYKGEKVVLVVGKSNTEQISIPNIIGQTYRESRNILEGLSLNMGEVIGGCEGCITAADTLNAYILDQKPGLGEYAPKHSEVDVRLTLDPSKIR